MITDERIAAYIDSLDKELPEFLRQLEKKALSEYVPIIKKPVQSLLRFLIANKKPDSILEVGTAVGFSSIFMSQYIKEEAHITTIEKMEERIRQAKENRKTAGKENQITILEGDAADILKSLKQQEKMYDMIFMDAAKGQYLNFLPDIFDLLRPGGLLISDNVLQDGDIVESRYAVTRRNRTIHFRMREYLYALTHSDSFETVVLPIGDGVTLSTKLVK
ncbi:O-methyltransferase [[Clostridium] polysaccharolyticum]|uniref:tRNA 5-hydroxyuridine methyltransferase n=1 Tax=[Clostridium] polysaccharolyticum TaxID=29364 RepID=A0A1H9ZQI3_9FIRM|nr:O-methyltransferase [[Clostridium] polysaccharolyticum]SES84044.1 Predicted O-methyltransferase YrrM [[Clostridium] polysaccharolyticum]